MDKTAKSEGHAFPEIVKAFCLPVIFGIIAGCAAVAILLLLFAAALTVMQVPFSSILWMVQAAAAAGGFFAGFFSARLRRKQGLLTGGIAGLLLCGVFLLAGFFVSGGLSAVQMISRLFLYLSSAMLGGVLGVNSRNGKRR